MARIYSILSGQVNTDFYHSIQIFGRWASIYFHHCVKSVSFVVSVTFEVNGHLIEK